MYVSVRSTDGIGIPGHVSAHVNTYLYTHTRASLFDCTHSRCETIVSSSSLSRYIPLLPLSISLSFLPLLPSRRFSCKWYGLCLVHYYYFFFPLLFSYLFTRTFHSFLTRQPQRLSRLCPSFRPLLRALFLHVVIFLSA